MANMKLITKMQKVIWPVQIGKSTSVEVMVQIATNDQPIKKHTEIRLLNISKGGKKRKAEMSICVGEL